MKKILFPALALILAACAAPNLTPDTPHVTLETPTLPPPTETPVPRPTLHPQFLSLQAQLASSGETYTLNQNGEIEMQTDEGMTIVPDIKVSPDGRMTFTHDGQEFTADTDTLVIEGQTITFKDTDGKTWVFDGTSLHEEIREFIPAETIEFTDKLSEVNLEINPEADLEAIYWDFVGTLVSSLKSTENNKEIINRILNDTSIPQDKRDSWRDLSNNSDKALRLELMEAFLKESGGKIDITTIGWVTLEGSDLNLPLHFESIQVNKIPEGYHNFIGVLTENGGAIRGAGKIYLRENGQVVISIAHQPNVLNEILNSESQIFYRNNKWTTEMIEAEAFLRLIEYHADRNVGIPLSGNLTTDPSLYLYGTNIVRNSDTSIRINFKNVKNGFLKIRK